METREVLELVAWILTGFWVLTILLVVVNPHWVPPLEQAACAFIGAVAIMAASVMLAALVADLFIALFVVGLFPSAWAFGVALGRVADYNKAKGRLDKYCKHGMGGD